MKQFLRFCLMLVSMSLVAFSASLTIKAAIGLSAWDAVAQSLSYVSTIKVGTIGMVLNISCVVGQILLLKKDFPLRQFLQVPVSVLLGSLINYFYYVLLAPLTLENYAVTLAAFSTGLLLASFAVGMVMVLDIITFPLEGFCMALAKKTNRKFSFVRQMVDVLIVLFTLSLTLIFQEPLTVREGTVFSMLIFAPLMGYFISKLEPIIQRKIEKTKLENQTVRD